MTNYPGETPTTVNFVLVNMIWTIIIKVDGKDVETKKYKNTDSFQKIWNPDVQVQRIDLNMFDEDDKPKKIVQFFFLDAKNKI